MQTAKPVMITRTIVARRASPGSTLMAVGTATISIIAISYAFDLMKETAKKMEGIAKRMEMLSDRDL